MISSVSAVIFPGHYLCGHQHNSGEAAGTVQFLIVHTLTWRHTGPGHGTVSQFPEKAPAMLVLKDHNSGATLRIFANPNRLSLMAFMDNTSVPISLLLTMVNA